MNVKLILSAALFFIAINSGNAQEHEDYFSAGYGAGAFSATFILNSGYSGSYKHTTTGPFYLKYEKRFSKGASAGLNLVWMKREYVFDYRDTTNISHHQVESQDEYGAIMRYNQVAITAGRFELYVGLGVGFKKRTLNYHDEAAGVFILNTVSPDFPFAFELTVGERLFLTESVGLFIETGIAKSVFQGGICYRI